MSETASPNRPEFPEWPEQSDTAKAATLFTLSSHPVPPGWIRSILLVKLAAADCNHKLGYLDQKTFTAIQNAILHLQNLPPFEFHAWFPLDAFQGGAGTALNMNVNEAIALKAHRLSGLTIDPLSQINLNQSTNDVLPTALHLSLLEDFSRLETDLATLVEAAQAQETALANVWIPGHTQLRDAAPLPFGRVFATWAAAFARDRWRVFKARERLKEVNLGGTMTGTGAGAPRSYVLKVIQSLQALTHHPVSRADDPVEATSNQDSIAEAMAVVGVLAANLRRTANDLRLLSSGPHSGLGLINLPVHLRGSSIMPGKVNPVVPEALIQISERLLSNDQLIMRVVASTELQLNAFLPLLAFTCHESLSLLHQSLPLLSRELASLRVDTKTASNQLEASYGIALALTPLFGYQQIETLIREAFASGQTLKTHILSKELLTAEDLDQLSAMRTSGSLGYDEAVYTSIRERLKGRSVP